MVEIPLRRAWPPKRKWKCDRRCCARRGFARTDHGQRVPADEALDAALQFLVTREKWLKARRNGIGIWSVRGERQVDAIDRGVRRGAVREFLLRLQDRSIPERNPATQAIPEFQRLPCHGLVDNSLSMTSIGSFSFVMHRVSRTRAAHYALYDSPRVGILLTICADTVRPVSHGGISGYEQSLRSLDNLAGLCLVSLVHA